MQIVTYNNHLGLSVFTKLIFFKIFYDMLNLKRMS